MFVIELLRMLERDTAIRIYDADSTETLNVGVLKDITVYKDTALRRIKKVAVRKGKIEILV